MKTQYSKALFAQAKQYIPGGVNSPVRSFYAVGGEPLFFKRGTGAYLTSVDDENYLDYVLSWGPLILGHAYPPVIKKIQEALEAGVSFGACTEVEVLCAKKITQLMPAIETIRMVNSGTEATMSAIRLARGYTGRDKIIKFEGCYHGHSDGLLVKAGSGALTFGTPSSSGVPATVAEHTLVADFNQLDTVQHCFETYPDQIACVILEPMAGNMNFVPASPAFVEGLRALCTQHGALLIFDEVMTGFRITLHGAQHYYGITPDLTCLGKVIGGGFPVGAFGGRADIMQQLAPNGPVYQAGTLSGNPVAMTAGLATLMALEKLNPYEVLNDWTARLLKGLSELAQHYHLPFFAQQVHSMFGFFFTEQSSVNSFQQVMACNKAQFLAFYKKMLEAGVYFAPSMFEAGFTSIAHGEAELAHTLNAAEQAFKNMR